MSDLDNCKWDQEKNLLFQEKVRFKSRNPNLVPVSFVESIESYMKAARQESWILENNSRIPNQEIVLRFFTVLSVATIKKNWKRLQHNLKQAGITYAASIELTDGKDGQPNNCVHYHFIIDTNLDRETLKEKMKAVCMKSKLGVYGKEFDLIFPNEGITNWGQWKIHYFTKYNHTNKVHLFKTGLHIKKFYYSSNWFIDANGTPTKKATILNRLKEEYKQKKPLDVPPAPCPVLSQYVSVPQMPYSGVLRIGR